jgi:hypothetical protein
MLVERAYCAEIFLREGHGMTVLETVADRQARWSATADALKATIDQARRSVFVLSILGALAAALASQMVPGADGQSLGSTPRTWVAIVGVICLAASTFFSSRLLGGERVAAWVRARAISEGLKREAYKFAAEAAPYDGTDRGKAGELLDDERAKIEDDGSDLLSLQTTAAGAGSTPRAPISHDDYIARRINSQIEWFDKKAAGYRDKATLLRRVEFGLALAATLITAIATVTGKTAPLWGVAFDFAALTAVLTTVAAAVLAHVEASRFDFLVTTYLATARRLENRRNRSQEPWSDFVNDCEGILGGENTSWIAKWTKINPVVK